MDVHGYPYAYNDDVEEGFRMLKRKSDTSLEFIVSKLKKSKYLSSPREENVFPKHQEIVKSNKSMIYLPRKPLNESYLPRKPLNLHRDNRISPVKEKFRIEEILKKDDDSKKFNTERPPYRDERFGYHGKSHFLQQLEEKHNKEYLNEKEHLNKKEYLKKDIIGSPDFNSKDITGSPDFNSKDVTGSHDFNSFVDEEISATEQQSHQIQEHNENDKIPETKCKKCNKRFYRRSQLVRHLSNHVVHECKQCHAVFYCVRKFKKHMAAHESYPCEFCGEEFYDASLWYQHRAKHTMVECTSCDMVFYNKTALLKHKLNHLSYLCPMCYQSCDNLNEWIAHRAFHGKHFSHQILSPRLNCLECRITFASQDHFLDHLCLYSKKLSIEDLEKKIEQKHIIDKEQKRMRNEHSSAYLKYDSVIRYTSPPVVKKYKRYNYKSRWGDTQDFSHLIGVDQTISCSN